MHSRFFMSMLVAASLSGCASPSASESSGADPGLSFATDPVGSQLPDDMKADGASWGAATTCKAIPAYDALPHPRIVVSVQGQTLHLIDDSVGFDKVFPIGPGAIDTDPTSLTYGESLSYYPVLANHTHDFVITQSGRTPCAIWHENPHAPLFAGLPFMSWSGGYGIHGPIDNFTADNGGSLRRGFVSHGCFRMEAAGILEVYARTQNAAKIPVHVQREPERRADGSRVDLAQKWIGGECANNTDCNFPGGICRRNPVSQRGFCTASCTQYCNDRAGNPSTFCAKDPQNPGAGICLPKVDSTDTDCRFFGDFEPATVTRPTQSVTSTVCAPAPRGNVGDACLASSDCSNGGSCLHGYCTVACNGLCADTAGTPTTSCMNDPRLSTTSTCARQCTPQSNASECEVGTQCIELQHNMGGTRFVCTPIQG